MLGGGEVRIMAVGWYRSDAVRGHMNIMWMLSEVIGAEFF